jgi:hypothetical protein
MGTEPDAAPEGVDLFDTPEEAAMSDWVSTPSAGAQVIEVRQTDDFDGVYVVVQTAGHPGFYDLDTASCVRAPGGKWWFAGSSG